MTWEKDKGQTVVINIKAERVYGYVYIGRPGKWGNPFFIGEDGTREEVVEKYREWINHPDQAKLKARIVPELKGRVLGCYCKPAECHGDVLAEIANGSSAAREHKGEG